MHSVDGYVSPPKVLQSAQARKGEWQQSRNAADILDEQKPGWSPNATEGASLEMQGTEVKEFQLIEHTFASKCASWEDGMAEIGLRTFENGLPGTTTEAQEWMTNRAKWAGNDFELSLNLAELLEQLKQEQWFGWKKLLVDPSVALFLSLLFCFSCAFPTCKRG
jgi:hypothetical protein